LWIKATILVAASHAQTLMNLDFGGDPNEIQTGWFGKSLRLGSGFLILWAGAGLVLRVRRDRFPRHTLAAR
jgi:hypothetical protein